MSTKIIEGRTKQSKALSNKWKDEEYRKHMLEVQKKIGFRSYGSKLTPYKK